MSTPSPKVETVTSTQNTEPWSKQIPYLEKGFAEAQKIYEGGPQQFYPGQTYANPDVATIGSLGAVESRALSGNPLLGQAQGEASKSLSGAYLDPNTNPGFQSMVDTVRAKTLPGIDARFISSGRTGSGLHGRAVGEGLGSAIGNLAYQNYGDERNRMTGAMGAAPGLAAADYNDPAMLAQVGAAREAQAQLGINEDVARFDQGQMAPSQSLAQFMQMIQGNYGGQTTGTTQQLIPQSNPWMQALGFGSSLAGAAGRIWGASDRRLKENIKPVGETFDGLPIYSYRYKGGSAPMMGVMAQEVAKVKPEAVGVMPSDYLAVDYGAI